MYAQTFVSRNAATHKHISAICGGSSLQTTTGAVTCGQTTTAEIGRGAVTAMQKRKEKRKKRKVSREKDGTMHQRYRECVSMRYHGARGMSEFLDFSRSVKKCGFTKWHKLSLERTEQIRKENERTDGDFCDSRTLRHLFNMGRMVCRICI